MAEVKLEEEIEPRELSRCPGGEPVQVKEEPELCIKQEPEEFPFHPITVKSEDDEDKSPVLHQRPTEEHTDSSSDTVCSEDYSQQHTPSKRSYAMIPPDPSVTDKPFSCPVCGKRCQKKSGLQSHLSAHSRKPHKCSVCEKSYALSDSLNVHMKSHTERVYIFCSFCEKRFKHKSIYDIHLRSHTGEKPFKCLVCERGFAETSSLRAHMRTHTGERPHSCSVCGKDFGTMSVVREHQTRVHNMCSVCKTPCSSRLDLKIHLKTHGKEWTGDRKYKRKRVKRFSCSECEKKFSSRYCVQRHMVVHSGEVLCKCTVCEKGFKDKSNLKIHMRTHTGEKPYLCSFCQKAFSRRECFALHLRTQHRTCPVCMETFKRIRELERHRRKFHKHGNRKQDG